MKGAYAHALECQYCRALQKGVVLYSTFFDLEAFRAPPGLGHEPGSPRESEVSVVTCDTYRECFEQGALSRRIFLRGTTAVEKNSSVVVTLFEISS